MSQLQKDYIDRTFSTPFTKLIYNVARDGNLDPAMVKMEPEVANAEKLVLMVGTIQNRKGPQLYGPPLAPFSPLPDPGCHHAQHCRSAW